MLSKEEMEECCRENYSLVFRYCLRQLSNRRDAEDATQETFVIFSRKSHLVEKKYVTPWLLTTAHHMVLREYRRRTVNKGKEVSLREDTLVASQKIRSFEEDLIDCYIDKYVDEIYAQLNEREKELFELWSDGTKKTGEIAQLLGIEPHACSMRVKRLKEKCREIMSEILFY